MSDHAHHMSSEEKVRLYFRVLAALAIITVLEVAATRLPGAKIIRDLIIVTFASSKAIAVGYYYMHLSHETKWLRIVAVLPVFMLLYTFVLIPDTIHSRPTSIYLPVRPRIFPPSHEELEKVEKAREEAEAALEREAPADEHAAPAEAAHGAPAAAVHETAPAAPAAPAAGGANDWR